MCRRRRENVSCLLHFVFTRPVKKITKKNQFRVRHEHYRSRAETRPVKGFQYSDGTTDRIHRKRFRYHNDISRSIIITVRSFGSASGATIMISINNVMQNKYQKTSCASL